MINTLQLAQWGLTLALETKQPQSVIQAHRRRVDHFTRALKPINERPSALLELVDVSMGELRKQHLKGTHAAVAQVIDLVERDFIRLGGVPYNEELTRNIVEALLPPNANADDLKREYLAFVEHNKAKLEHVFGAYVGDSRHLLLSQPESLLVFFLKDSDPGGLVDRWPETFPSYLYENLDGVWVSEDDL